MRITLLFVMFMVFSNHTFAEPVRLHPFKGSKKLAITKTKAITGVCGKAVVRVLGVKNEQDNVYSSDVDGAKIVIRNPPKKELVFDSNSGVISDYTGMACIGGNRLLIWSDCGGSACGRGYNFTVIDTENLIILAPKDPREQSCDDKCASQALDGFSIYRLFL